MYGPWAKKILVDGASQIIVMRGAPLPSTVYAKPAPGDTVTIEYSVDDGATYTAWALGGVTVNSDTTFDSGVTHLRGTRTAGSGTTSEFGVC